MTHIPQASLARPHRAWEWVGSDVAEFSSLSWKKKTKFILFVDLATKLVSVGCVAEYPLNEARAESADQLIDLFTTHWLQDRPDPMWFFGDAAKSYGSKKFRDFLGDTMIGDLIGPGQAPEGHGDVEIMIKLIKTTARIIHKEKPALNPMVCIKLSVAAHNALETVRGYSPFQWAYGRSNPIVERALRAATSGMESNSTKDDFMTLLQERDLAETAYRKSKALTRLSILQNTKSRQPLKDYNTGEKKGGFKSR